MADFPLLAHSSGKERDTESGLDYFGARYYASSMGRFMSPDPLLNSGKPSEPQSWNRYSYVSNNPLSRIDPTGMYDFRACASGDNSCAAEQTRFNNAVKKANELLETMNPNSDKAKALSKALGAVGLAGDGNGVTVGFGPTVTGAPMKASGRTITVDFTKYDSAIAMVNGGDGYHGITSAHTDPVVDLAGKVVHEGTHVAGGGEREAYTAQSWTSKAGKSFDTSGVWNPSWAKGPDAEKLRERGIRDGVERSTMYTNMVINREKKPWKRFLLL